MRRGRRVKTWFVTLLGMVPFLYGCDGGGSWSTPTRGTISPEVVVESGTLVDGVHSDFGPACFVRGTVRNVSSRRLHADVAFSGGKSDRRAVVATTRLEIEAGRRAPYSAAFFIGQFGLPLGYGGVVSTCQEIDGFQLVELVTCDAAVAQRASEGTPLYCPP
jgi:hypothetical protein